MTRPGNPSDNYANIILPNLQMIEGMFRAGATRDDVANALNVSVSMLYEYQKRPELSEAIKNGERGATENVVAALYRKATRGGGDGLGDTTAQIFWLKNKDSKNWRDKQQMEMTQRFDIGSLSDGELDALIRRGEAMGDESEV